MKKHIGTKVLRLTRFFLKGVRFLLLLSPAIALIVIAYITNLFYFRIFVDVAIGILGSLYRNNVLWLLLGVYAVFMLVCLLLNMSISFIESKLKKEEDSHERIDR